MPRPLCLSLYGQAGGANVYSFAGNNPISYADPSGLDVSIGDIAGQLGSADTWREGVATAGYALGNLVTLGHAYGQYSNRPGFRASQVAWGIGGAAGLGAGAVAAAPVVASALASHPLFAAWASGGATVGGAGLVRQAGESCEVGKDLWRAVGDAELEQLESNGGRFMPSPFGSESKYFWGSPESAEGFTAQLPAGFLNGGGMTVVKTRIADPTLLEGPFPMDTFPDAYVLSNSLLHVLEPATRH